jgi:hypothetical protein
MARDEFPVSVKMVSALRVAFRCSNPGCGVATCGPHSDPGRALKLGDAAHITAASPGGPRYDGSLTADQRKDISNAIWLCVGCARLIDADEEQYAVGTLRAWKAAAEAQARLALEERRPLSGPAGLSPEAMQILVAASQTGQVFLLSVSQLAYPIIAAGECHFFSNDDPLLGATYAEAFESLVSLGLARHAGGQLYVLTVQGFKLGRAIAESLQQATTTAVEGDRMKNLTYELSRVRNPGGENPVAREVSLSITYESEEFEGHVGSLTIDVWVSNKITEWGAIEVAAIREARRLLGLAGDVLARRG